VKTSREGFNLLRGSGVSPKVEFSLSRLINLRPHEVGEPFKAFAPNFLHSLNLCVTRNFFAMIDALIMMHHVKTKEHKSTEHCLTGAFRRLLLELALSLSRLVARRP
jgi:hypothetical protein